MSSFHFWATLITAFVLGVSGFFLGAALPLPEPFDIYTGLIYAVMGILIGLTGFTPFSTWLVKWISRLAGQFISRISYEVINQLTQLTSRGWRVGPGSEVRESLRVKRLADRGVVIIDTSSIIDGRVLEVAKSGFVSGFLLVPEFVLTELRQVADSGDALKRARGRYGFEVVEHLKKVNGVKLEIWDKEVSGKLVDDKLIRLAKILHGKILTCDFNLNRTARLNGVRVLNLNELANSLKTLPIPGERLAIKIVQPGKDKNQGVGYCFDGTMVVVKDAANLTGQEANIEVTKILQGPSGRIIFGKKAE